MTKKADSTRINREIKAKEVRVVSSSGEHLGVKSLSAAIAVAEEEGFDLVEVSPDAVPPVCKIMDYGKFKYQKSKREHDSKKHQKIIQVKELKLRPGTEQHDFEFKFKHAQKFLEQGNKVKLSVNFRGRELSHTEIGRDLLLKMAQDLKEVGDVELSPKREGRRIVMIMAPLSGSDKTATNNVKQPQA